MAVGDDVRILRISYKNDTGNEPHTLVLPGCTELCPLERFKGMSH
jgi:hypothetical protein